MHALYSVSLLISFACGGVAIVLAALAWPRTGAAPGLARLAFSSALLGAAALALSVVVHWNAGHGAGSSEPMQAAELSRAHPAFLVALLIHAAAAGAAFLAGRRRPGGEVRHS
ncbi:MAG: hypothetical protein DWQ36_20520 [Acidobacteria bacterium]|nr:MAG: hypothetical protein DWQ30_20945 [Acidobacteriota bacterium]REK03255.1 MAG: hypothetical protein DWQ36_20520 [Acidobacteriota bacterium]